LQFTTKNIAQSCVENSGCSVNLSFLILSVTEVISNFQNTMPRKYKRKTDRAVTPMDVLRRAAERVAAGQSIRSVAKDF